MKFERPPFSISDELGSNLRSNNVTSEWPTTRPELSEPRRADEPPNQQGAKRQRTPETDKQFPHKRARYRGRVALE